LGLGAWYGGAVQVCLDGGIGDNARTKSREWQVITPFPSGCSHWKKGRGVIVGEVVGVAHTVEVVSRD